MADEGAAAQACGQIRHRVQHLVDSGHGIGAVDLHAVSSVIRFFE